eukprot:7390618-Prymnesium_polylepis.1
MQYLGISLQSKCNQLFNLETRDDRTLVWTVIVLPAGESPRAYAQRVKPESFDAAGESWYLELILLGMREDSNLISYELTRVPDQEDEVSVAGETTGKARPKPTGAGGKGKKNAAAKAAAAAVDKRGAGQNTVVQATRWVCADLRAVGYSHKEFSPASHAFDGAADGAADVVLMRDAPMRVPIVHDTICRHLGDAAGREHTTPLQLVLVICALHGAMRTCESNLNLLSAALREAYTNDDGEDRANIEKYWIGAMKQVGIRHCMYMTQTTPEPPKVSVNGKEARKVEEDFAKLRGIDAQACVAKGEFPSVIVQGYYNAALACGLDVENLDQIIEVLAHWSSVAEIMRMMKPTPSDREKFRRECRLYRAKKMVVWGAGCWYDAG